MDAPNIALVSAHPARYSKGVVLHLRELDGKRTSMRLSSPVSSSKTLMTQELNVLEEPLTEPTRKQIFAPYETKFLGLEKLGGDR